MRSTVRRIHIGLYFEANPEKSSSSELTSLVVVGVHGGGAISTNAYQQFLHAEIVDGAAEEPASGWLQNIL